MNSVWKINIKTKITVGLLLVAPAVILKFFTSIYPNFVTIMYSFMEFRPAKQDKFFIGFQNYIDMFSDINFIRTIEFTVIFVVSTVVIHIIIGVGIALILNIKFRGRKLLRSMILIPWAIPTIVIGIAARWVFNDTYGFINDIIRRFVNDFHFDWLIHKWSARIAIIIVDAWKGIPFFAILILASLQSIPDELYEAAEIDGASKFTLFTRITLPQIRGLIVLLTIFFTLWRLISFDIVYAMTGGGPGASTSIISYRVWREVFMNMNYGYGSSIAVMLAITVIFIASLGFFIMSKINVEE